MADHEALVFQVREGGREVTVTNPTTKRIAGMVLEQRLPFEFGQLFGAAEPGARPRGQDQSSDHARTSIPVSIRSFANSTFSACRVSSLPRYACFDMSGEYTLAGGVRPSASARLRRW